MAMCLTQVGAGARSTRLSPFHLDESLSMISAVDGKCAVKPLVAPTSPFHPCHRKMEDVLSQTR